MDFNEYFISVSYQVSITDSWDGDLQATDWATEHRLSIPGRGQKFLSSPNALMGSGNHPASNLMRYCGPFCGGTEDRA
jgi:hypothetical protein